MSRIWGIWAASVIGVLTGCSGSGTEFSARHLNQRLATNLSQPVAARQATVETLPDGARVNLNEASLFQPARNELTSDGAFVVASMAESLLDPRLMQVDVTGAPNTSDDLRLDRVRRVREYMQAFTLGPELPVAAQAPTANSPTDVMTITIHVHCPPGPQGSTWRYGGRVATCD